MDGLLSEIQFASDIEPALNTHLAGKRIERVEWHDGHGDVIIFHMEDRTRLRVTTPYVNTFLRCEPDATKLHLGLTKKP